MFTSFPADIRHVTTGIALLFMHIHIAYGQITSIYFPVSKDYWGGADSVMARLKVKEKKTIVEAGDSIVVELTKYNQEGQIIKMINGKLFLGRIDTFHSIDYQYENKMLKSARQILYVKRSGKKEKMKYALSDSEPARPFKMDASGNILINTYYNFIKDSTWAIHDFVLDNIYFKEYRIAQKFGGMPYKVDIRPNGYLALDLDTMNLSKTLPENSGQCDCYLFKKLYKYCFFFDTLSRLEKITEIYLSRSRNDKRIQYIRDEGKVVEILTFMDPATCVSKTVLLYENQKHLRLIQEDFFSPNPKNLPYTRHKTWFNDQGLVVTEVWTKTPDDFSGSHENIIRKETSEYSFF